jgi:hypothetical protein
MPSWKASISWQMPEGLSRAEVVRRAVALLAFAKKEDQEGLRMGFFVEEAGVPGSKRS